MKRYIDITRDNREFLMKAFGVTDKTILNAITFDALRGNTELAKRIRKLALERGGTVMVEVAEIETWHDTDGHVRQYFPNGVVLDGDKKSGKVVLLVGGKVARSYDNPKISEMESIQREAMALR